MTNSADFLASPGRSLSRIFLAAAIVLASTCSPAGELTVYSSAEADNLKIFADAFAKAHPEISVKWVQGSTGAIQSRLIAEKDKPVADVVFAHTAGNMDALASAGLLQPYEPQGIERVSARFVDTRTPPAWVGLYGWASAICVNTTLARQQGLAAPTTWEDLLKPEYKGKIVMPNPGSSGTGALLLTGWVQMWGEEKAWAYLDRLNKNVAEYTASGSRPCEMVAKGDAVIGLSLPARGARLKAAGAPIDVLIAADGTGWDLQAVGIVRQTPNLADAKTFMDWAVSVPAMETYGANAELTAVRVRVRKPEFLPPNITEKMIKVNFQWLAKEQGRLVAEWQRRYATAATKN